MLGMLSAAVVGACVSPVLISFLGVAIAGGDAVLGAHLMTVTALGMGLPLILLGFGAGHLIQTVGGKIGRHMRAINYLFGFALITVAIYLLGALPAVPVLFIWGAFLLVVGFHFGASELWPQDTLPKRVFFQGLGMVLVMWAALAVVGGVTGERNMFKPWPPAGFFTADESVSSERIAFTRVQTVAELTAHFAQAARDNKPVILEYYADWCADCIRMEQTTFRDARVADILRRDFVALKIDATDPRDANIRALKKRFNVFGPPAFLFFDRNGAPRADLNFYGYRNAARFYKLTKALSL